MITTALEKNKNKKPCPDYLKNSSQKKKKKEKSTFSMYFSPCHFLLVQKQTEILCKP